jgi:glycosyltransferase involved in cell wall biosynthesis
MDENSQQIKAKKFSIVFRDGRFHRKTPHIENTKEIKKSELYKKSSKVNSYNKKILCLNFIVLMIILLSIMYHNSIEKNSTEERKCIQNYMDLIFSGTKIDRNRVYYPSNNPKISIIISVFNGEAFLRTALLSIQNQDFKDIEIIMIDDGSQDNSVNLIKELMKTEPRIVLLENGNNKGILYTKTKAILHAKGKYVMTMDEDDIYVQRDAFSLLYNEAEKNSLDILGFIFTHSGKKISRKRNNFKRDKRRIIYQPELSNLMYHLNSDGKVEQFHGYLVSHFIKTELFKKIINFIDKKNLEEKMNYHDDYILFFLLTRNANSIKYINRIFYVVLTDWNKNEPKVSFRTRIKEENIDNKKCFGGLIFSEMLFKNTKNTFKDKKIAFSQLDKWYLQRCRINKDTKDKAIEILQLYLNNKYISVEDKKKIEYFIERSNSF